MPSLSIPTLTDILGDPHTWIALQTYSAGLTVSAGVLTFNVVPQTSQGGHVANTGYGTGALNSNSGQLNSAFGYRSLYSNTTGGANSAFGYGSLYSNTTGSFSAAFGYNALYNFNDTISANDYLVGIGYSAGYNYLGTERNNIVIGYNFGITGESSMLRIGNPTLGGTNGQIALSLISLAGLGVPAIYGTVGLGVNLGTAATQIAKWTPTKTGFYSVRIAISCKTASTVTLTISYADPQAGTISAQSIYSKALTAGQTDSLVFNLWATSGTAITLNGTDSVAAGDAYASAQIEELQ